MPSEFRLVQLGAANARRVADLERQVYPRAFWTGEEDFREDLSEAERCGKNFSRGLVDARGELVAYLVAFLDESEETGDRVVYGSDLAVRPDLQGQGLGGKLLIEVLKAVGGRHVCEGHCRKASYDMLVEHPKVLARVGYRLAASRRLRRYNGGEDHWWIRLELLTR